MEVLQAAGQAVVRLIRMVYNLLWGDIVQIPLPGGSSDRKSTRLNSSHWW